MGPGDSGGGVCACHRSGAGRVRFAVVRGLFVGGIVPVVPAGGVEVGGEFGVDVDDARVRSPGTAEAGGVVGGGGAFCSGGGGAQWGGGVGVRGGVGGSVGVELGTVEDGGGVAEDEVDAAFDVGVDVILAAVVGEERVLVAEEAAVFEDAAVGAVGYGDSLAGVSRGVFEGEVVGFEAGA